MTSRTGRWSQIAVGLLAGLAATCHGPHQDFGGQENQSLPSTRGYILLSVSGLRADRLGFYGYSNSTSPFLDSLAARGAVFEHAIAQYPSTLTSHVSMFSALYPQQHGVYPPVKLLSSELEVFPERFSNYGFLSGGFTEGGFVSSAFGFDRGFDEFDDSSDNGKLDRNLRLAIGFLNQLSPHDRFLLFVQGRVIRYRQAGDSSGQATADAGYLRIDPNAVNSGFSTVDPAVRDTLSEQFDHAVGHLDGVLEKFFDELDTLGLSSQTTVIVTADHGTELLEHGKITNAQLYPETIRIPLLILHPALRIGQRVAQPVQSVDLVPTLYQLAGIPGPTMMSGRSLLPLLDDRSDQPEEPTAPAYAEVVASETQQTLVERREETTYQLLRSSVLAERDGAWVTRSVAFDLDGGEHTFSIVSFDKPREVMVEVDGEPRESLQVHTRWSNRVLSLATTGRHRVRLATADCSSPKLLGKGNDPRCLSFKVRGLSLERVELFDLTHDPEASKDLSFDEPELMASMVARLAGYRWRPLAAPQGLAPTSKIRLTLQNLGYLP